VSGGAGAADEEVWVKGIVWIAGLLAGLGLWTAPAIADPATVGLWHLDAGGGTVAADSSGQGNDGTLSGSVTWVPGRFGDALAFSGASARVTVPDSPSLEPAAAVTVSAWVRAAGAPGPYRYVIAKGATGCTAASYALYTGAQGGAAFYVSSGHGRAYTLSPPVVPERIWDGIWHYVAGTFDGGQVRFYFDGGEVGSGTPYAAGLSYQLIDSNELFIGDYPGCAEHNFSGAIDEVTILSRALSAAEVRSAWEAANSPASGGQPPVVGGVGPGTPAGPGPGGAPPGKPSPLGPARGPSGGQPPSRVPVPRVLSLRLEPSAFSASGSRRGARAPTAMIVSYVDTRAETTTFKVLRAGGGHRRGRACLRGRGRGPRCVRYQLVGSFRHGDRAGLNRFRFARLRGRPLPPGTYRLEATPDSGGRQAVSVSVRFDVLP
jgi:hypothetical protein